jgi:putative transposase
MITRRTVCRFFLLRPDEERRAQRLFLYLLAVAAETHGVRVHAFIQMSTHYHLVVTDERGVLPDFMRDLNRWLAHTFKCLRGGWEGALWDSQQCSVVDLETNDAVLKETAYVVCNGAEAGIEPRPEDHPGAVSAPSDIGRREIVVSRPPNPWLVSDGRWPPVARLRYALPPGLVAEHGESGARRAIMTACERRAAELARDRAAQGRGYQGAEAAMRLSPTTRATSVSPPGRQRRPTHAVGPNRRDALRRKAVERRDWLASYARCWERWRSGDRDVVWPAHTWKMRVVHRQPCAPP